MVNNKREEGKGSECSGPDHGENLNLVFRLDLAVCSQKY